MDQTCFTPEYWAEFYEKGDDPLFTNPELLHRKPATLEESREMWNQRAAGFAHKFKRSGYIAQLVEKLDLAPGTTVLDMGCGSGTLAVPLALRGCQVHAVDFSPAMLEELANAASAAGVEIPAYQCAWQESWDDLPVCDVVMSSRSFTTHDLADGIAKMEAHAKSRCMATHAVSEGPWMGAGLQQALGRPLKVTPPKRFIAFVNYLFCLGRQPKVDYIVYQSQWHGRERDELIADLRRSVEPQGQDEENKFQKYVDGALVFDEEIGGWRFDCEKTTRWALVEWEPK